MAYVKQTWVNGPSGNTPLSADRLNHMEDGIEDADTRLTAAEAAIDGKADATHEHDVYAFQPVTSSTRPANPFPGQNIYETDTGLHLMWRDDISTWILTAVPSNIMDAKGDLIVGSANDTSSRLAVGADGSVLMADSSETLGVRWGSGVKPFPPVALSDATTIATDASLGTHFRVTISGNRTLGVPSNPTDGQVCVWEVTASGNDRTLTLSSSTGGFEFGADVTEVPTIAEDTTTYIQAVYNASANRWRVIGVVGGY